ncbi:hypothetical protein CALCODRAFT_500863 [Calocera cornea HHB12733]|uniref:F-box domain-containing protein n=1 Tax=Calocera cornea HHB12733 TaxID=1353952 RepID=A0A165DWX1_9BASI|nr:hypothetical protein CALCODRAFT_500863 [Calocera cornea HHB12733]
MHRLWSIPEIVDEIVSFTEGEGRDSWAHTIKTYVGLATTASLFSIPATRRLWARIDADALWYLLFSLRGSDCHWKTTSDRVARYAFYEQFIRELFISEHDDILPELLQEYIAMTALRPCAASTMPNLTRLCVTACGPKGDPEYNPPLSVSAHPVATLFLVPTLRTIVYMTYARQLEEDDCMEEATTFFEAIPIRCPSLTELSIQGSSSLEVEASSYNPFATNLSEITSDLPLLSSFSCPGWIISPRLLRSLGLHTQLTELNLHYAAYDPNDPLHRLLQGRLHCRLLPGSPAFAGLIYPVHSCC